MRKLERRAILCIIIAIVLLLGTGLFVFRLAQKGGKWATFYANQHIYNNGRISVGRIYDRNGELLMDNQKGTAGYNADLYKRLATAHAVGDIDGYVATSAEAAFRDKLVGYSFASGIYSVSGIGNDVKLSIDAEAGKIAYQALAGRNGLVAVYDYTTGEVVCMVSSPSFDPMNAPSAESAASGTFMNKFLSGTLTPGSIFKLITTAAAIENLDDLDSWTYTCKGYTYVDGEKITCHGVHGTVDFDGALSHSCNCAFAELTQEIGSETMAKYAEKCGLSKSYNINGIANVKGSFEFPSDSKVQLSWAGIGQWHDQLNPCSMLVYISAIATDGKGTVPSLLHEPLAKADKTSQMIEEETAEKLRKMMKNNVVSEYGAGNYPGLDIYAKTGTAEVSGQQPNAWFAGFIDDDEHPYAFIVCVENGGYGSSAAGPVANKVLQYLVSK